MALSPTAKRHDPTTCCCSWNDKGIAKNATFRSLLVQSESKQGLSAGCSAQSKRPRVRRSTVAYFTRLGSTHLRNQDCRRRLSAFGGSSRRKWVGCALCPYLSAQWV